MFFARSLFLPVFLPVERVSQYLTGYPDITQYDTTILKRVKSITFLINQIKRTSEYLPTYLRMAPELPTGFMSVEAAANKHGSILSVIGVVTDSLPPLRSRGTGQSNTIPDQYLLPDAEIHEDYQFTFTVVDGSSQLNNDFGLKVKFFRPSPEELPPIQSNGDIIILRNIKVSSHFSFLYPAGFQY